MKLALRGGALIPPPRVFWPPPRTAILLLYPGGRPLPRGPSDRGSEAGAAAAPPPRALPRARRLPRPGRGGSRVPPPRAGSTTNCRLLFGQSLSCVPPRQDRRSRVNSCSPPQQSLCGPGIPWNREEVPHRAPPPSGTRSAGLARTPIRTFIPRRRGCLEKRSRPAGEGRKAAQRSLRCRAARKRSSPAAEPGGKGRAGQRTPSRRSPPLPGTPPGPARHRCGRLATKSSGDRQGDSRGGVKVPPREAQASPRPAGAQRFPGGRAAGAAPRSPPWGCRERGGRCRPWLGKRGV
ncbi:translation initiation factor IF-2-like [Aquila chrysaetos chrysaetos]|uniref:translation initiation factor IF-2-like n=1 Tax=Aquila chrysaetos chrysaetos TaxID=223781 RepID=UPI0011771051|nr:translation initiation factor IF-2-like [Aquila chrysaetos chrysaetos]